jgi:transcription elongation GreA/GreB family factor
MRDEEGRSALDRAKERTDGEHQNVVKVLTDATRDNDTAETERDECDEDEPAHVEEGKIIDISESIPAEQSIPTAEKFDSMVIIIILSLYDLISTTFVL